MAVFETFVDQIKEYGKFITTETYPSCSIDYYEMDEHTGASIYYDREHEKCFNASFIKK